MHAMKRDEVSASCLLSTLIIFGQQAAARMNEKVRTTFPCRCDYGLS